LPPSYYIESGIWKRIYSPEELTETNGKLSELLTGTPADELKTSNDNIILKEDKGKKPSIKIRLNSDNKTVRSALCIFN
jgi:hypothetical protein